MCQRFWELEIPVLVYVRAHGSNVVGIGDPVVSVRESI